MTVNYPESFWPEDSSGVFRDVDKKGRVDFITARDRYFVAGSNHARKCLGILKAAAQHHVSNV